MCKKINVKGKKRRNQTKSGNQNGNGNHLRLKKSGNKNDLGGKGPEIDQKIDRGWQIRFLI